MIMKKVSKTKLRKYCSNLFTKKLISTKKTRGNWIRQVRKFSSNFLFEKKKFNFLNFLSNLNNYSIKSLSFKKSKFKQKRLMTRRLVDNRFNRLIGKKIYIALKKVRKANRMKKTSKRFRKLSFFFKNPKELFRENPLNRFYTSNVELLSFSYSLLLSFHSAIGNSSKSWINPSVFSKILAIRNDMILYDLTSMFIALKKGLQSVFQVSKFRGSVIGYVDMEKNYKFSGAGFDHFLRSWLPGYLTNFKQVMKNILSLQTKNIYNLTRRQSKFLMNIDLRRKMPFNYNYYLMKRKERSRKKVNKIPAVPSFGFSLQDYDIWVNECQRIGLRTMAVCDSESFPRKIDFPLIANQKSLPLSFFLVKLVSEVIGSAKRFEYFSFIGFNMFHKVNKRINKKVDDSLLKKISFAVTGNLNKL